MGLIKYINPTEILFLTWIQSPIESFHQCDLNRFYNFIEAVVFYKKTEGSAWYNKDYFFQRCKKIKKWLDDELLDNYYHRFEIIDEYNNCKKIKFKKTKYIDSDSNQLACAINDEMYFVEVSFEELYMKNLSIKKFLKLYNERNKN